MFINALSAYSHSQFGATISATVVPKTIVIASNWAGSSALRATRIPIQ